ncbi:MAG TPA: hypothetical protein VF518_09100, partial [Polyangia bacterium]
MKQHHGKLIAGLACAASFAVAASAYAQAPAPTDTTPPPSLMPAPRPMGPDDMSGQLGFGLGVVAGTSLVAPNTVINVKYWLSDILAVMPQLQIKLFKPKGGDTQWAFSPNALVLYNPWKTTSTRLSVGAGLGLTLAKWGAAGQPNLGANPTAGPPNDVWISFHIPIYAGVEHFFTKWFSMGIAV